LSIAHIAGWYAHYLEERFGGPMPSRRSTAPKPNIPAVTAASVVTDNYISALNTVVNFPEMGIQILAFDKEPVTG